MPNNGRVNRSKLIQSFGIAYVEAMRIIGDYRRVSGYVAGSKDLLRAFDLAMDDEARERRHQERVPEVKTEPCCKQFQEYGKHHNDCPAPPSPDEKPCIPTRGQDE